MVFENATFLAQFLAACDNIFVKGVVLAIAMDTFLGCLRAAKYHKWNSSVGIDGAIRKVAMVVSGGILMLADLLIHVNLLAFVPEEYVHYLGIQKLGMCEFFCLLFTACECLSVLKNMVLCGLPVPKKIEGWLRDFLVNMTSELPAEGSSEDKADKADRSSLPDKDVLGKGGVHHVG